MGASDGMRRAGQVGELREALEAIKWGTDYLLQCHTEPKKFVAMYGQSEARARAPFCLVLGRTLKKMSCGLSLRPGLCAHSK